MPLPARTGICLSSHPLPMKDGVKHKQSAYRSLTPLENDLMLRLWYRPLLLAGGAFNNVRNQVRLNKEKSMCLNQGITSIHVNYCTSYLVDLLNKHWSG